MHQNIKSKELIWCRVGGCKWTHYAWALICVSLATMVRFPLQPFIGHNSPFIFYLPVVLVIAAAFGLKPGLVATAASVLPANYFWMVPEGTFSLDFVGACQMLVFSIAGCSVSWISETARRRKELEEHLRATIANMGDAVVTTDCRGRIVYLNSMARVLTGLDGESAIGRTIGSALELLDEESGHRLNAVLQTAVNDDKIERLPERVIMIGKGGKRHLLEQRISRILSPDGRKLGVAILLHCPASSANPGESRISESNDDPINAKSRLPRIAMVSTHGYVSARPPLGAADTGGQVVYVLELSKKLAQLGYEVDIWTRRFEDQPEIERVTDQVRVIGIPCAGREFIPKEYLCDSLPEWNENALRFISRHNLNYRFINSHYWDGGVAGDALSKALGVPHIHTPHSLGIWKKRQMETDFPGDAANFESRYNFSKRIHHEREIYGSADFVIATSPQQLILLSNDYAVPKEKCHMVPPGYDDSRFFPVGESARDAIRRRLGFTMPIVQSIGRLAHNKGYELLIQAFQLVAQRIPEVSLHLAVGGENLTAREQAVLDKLKERVSQLGLADKVRFESFIPDEQLPDYYRAADVFVLPSRYEPFGMTAVEAMACGTPTVLTVHGGLYQAVTFGQDGLYADPFDPEDLGIMISKILRHPRLRSRLSRMGAHKTRSLFTWTGVAQQFIALAEHQAIEPPVVGDEHRENPWIYAD